MTIIYLWHHEHNTNIQPPFTPQHRLQQQQQSRSNSNSITPCNNQTMNNMNMLAMDGPGHGLTYTSQDQNFHLSEHQWGFLFPYCITVWLTSMNTPHLNFDKNTNFPQKNFFQFPFVIALLSSNPTAPIYGDLGETQIILLVCINDLRLLTLTCTWKVVEAQLQNQVHFLP